MSNEDVPGSVGASAAIYARGKLRLLGSYHGEATVATSVNALGDAVGYACNKDHTACRALKFAAGEITDLGSPGRNWVFNMPTTINDAGDIYGTTDSATLSDAPKLARFRPGAATFVFGCIGPGRGEMHNVNDSGIFVATSFIFATDISDACKGYREKGASLFPQDSWASANWINDAGTIVGAVNQPASPTLHPRAAYEYASSGATTVFPLFSGADDMEPTGINSRGDFVGTASNSSNPNYFRIFYNRNGTMHDITTATGRFGAPLPGLSNSGALVTRTYLVELSTE